MSATWLILGATSAMAKAFARQAAGQGAHLILAGRDMSEIELLAQDCRLRGAPSATALSFDATQVSDLKRLVTATEAAAHPLSIFLAFGAMPEEGTMRIEPELCARMIHTNYTGAVLAIDALLPQLEEQKAGAVVLVGSVAGDRGRKKNFRYGSSKAGLAAYAQGLAAHLSDYGVPVTLVKPGVIDTAMTWGLKGPPLPLGSPEGLAQACWKKAPKGGTLYFPWFWWGIMGLIIHLPRKIFNKLNF